MVRAGIVCCHCFPFAQDSHLTASAAAAVVADAAPISCFDITAAKASVASNAAPVAAAEATICHGHRGHRGCCGAAAVAATAVTTPRDR